MNRPPADRINHEAILDKKCAVGNHDKFFQWCSVGEGTIDTVCEGIAGGAGECHAKVNFSPKPLFEPVGRNRISSYFLGRAANVTTTVSTVRPNITNVSVTTAAPISNTTTVPTPQPDATEPIYFNFDQNCEFGLTVEKKSRLALSELLSPEQFNKIRKFCYQEVYGVPYSMPLWLILLILFLVLLAVSIAASLFWTYWVKKRFYGKPPGHLPSQIESHWSLSPASTVSDVSAIRETSRSARSRAAKISKRSGASHTSPSQASSRSNSSSRSQGSRTSNASLKTINTKATSQTSRPASGAKA